MIITSKNKDQNSFDVRKVESLFFKTPYDIEEIKNFYSRIRNSTFRKRMKYEVKYKLRRLQPVVAFLKKSSESSRLNYVRENLKLALKFRERKKQAERSFVSLIVVGSIRQQRLDELFSKDSEASLAYAWAVHLHMPGLEKDPLVRVIEVFPQARVARSAYGLLKKVLRFENSERGRFMGYQPSERKLLKRLKNLIWK